jgi:hypothetical protein
MSEELVLELVICWHCGEDVFIDFAVVIVTKSGPVWVCEECGAD